MCWRGATGFERVPRQVDDDCANASIASPRCSGAENWDRTSGHRFFKPALYQLSYLCKKWSALQGSNLRPPGPKLGALPDCAKRRFCAGASSESRTRLFSLEGCCLADRLCSRKWWVTRDSNPVCLRRQIYSLLQSPMLLVTQVIFDGVSNGIRTRVH